MTIVKCCSFTNVAHVPFCCDDKTQTHVHVPAVSFPEQMEEEAEYEACVEHATQQSASTRVTIDALKPKHVRNSELGRRIKTTKKKLM